MTAAAIQSKPEIRPFKLSELNPATYNPRKISDANMQGLQNSISRFNCVELIIVNVRDGRNVIVGGHQRHRALIMLHGPDCEVDCVVVDLSEGEERLLNIALNNPEIQGEFDLEKLAESIERIRQEMPGDTGLIDLQIEQLCSEMGFAEKAGNIQDDDIPEPPKETITRAGDLWILGEHRLLCGDSTNPEHVARLMDGQLASLFATDPPYCIDYTGKDRPNGGKDWTDVYHEIDIPDSVAFVKAFYNTGFKHIKPNTALYLWHSGKKIAEIHDICKELNILIHQTIVWVKPCVVMTFSFYSWRHEPCLLMWKQGENPPYQPNCKSIGTVWPVGFVKDGDPNTPEYYTDIWELDWDGKKRPSGMNHPTSKPVELFAIPMRVHTQPGEICYEPFSGSGSQIIAAEKLNRRCFAMELEPFFVDVAIKRWEEWTGRKAERVQI
jgi:DNA modification methylase